MYERFNFFPSSGGLIATSSSKVPVMSEAECANVIQDPRLCAEINRRVQKELNEHSNNPDNLPWGEEVRG